MAGSEAHGPRAVRVTPEDVRRLCEFLYRRSGMLFDDNKRYYIDRRLVERIGATESDSFQAYFAVIALVVVEQHSGAAIKKFAQTPNVLLSNADGMGSVGL